jgi:hypothetical protein
VALVASRPKWIPPPTIPIKKEKGSEMGKGIGFLHDMTKLVNNTTDYRRELNITYDRMDTKLCCAFFTQKK